ncbi:hypothetical protein PUN28_019077 [Cardiocondyla obscurior]|uniref:Uncharacterized protein n=1 Tax=Cardiocondyla obscurior TaxID=286306 RepID=A0AAW2EH74_9HYME
MCNHVGKLFNLSSLILYETLRATNFYRLRKEEEKKNKKIKNGVPLLVPKDLAKEETFFNELLEFKGHNIFLQTAVRISRAIPRTRDFALIKPFILCVLVFTVYKKKKKKEKKTVLCEI